MLPQVSTVFRKRAERAMVALTRNNMKTHLVDSREEVIPLLKKFIPVGSSVSYGGSQTLEQCAVIPFLRQSNYQVLDRNAPGLTPEEVKEVQRQAFLADFYLCSANAITEDGYLYAVDGNGNRVAAMVYGPEKVFVIAGYNKIVADKDAAQERVRRLAAPANMQRLGLDTPCKTTGICVDCNSPERICCSFLFLGPQRVRDRIQVILVGESLGY